MAIITTAEVKERIDITGSTYDTQISNIIDKVDQTIKTWAGQSIEAESKTINFEGKGKSYFLFANMPVNSITSVKYKTEPLGSQTTVSSSDYGIVETDGIYKLYNKNTFYAGYLYEVVFNYGYNTVPEDVKNTAIEMAMALIYDSDFLGGDDGRFGFASKQLNSGDAGSSTVNYINGMRNEWITTIMRYATLV